MNLKRATDRDTGRKAVTGAPPVTGNGHGVTGHLVLRTLHTNDAASTGSKKSCW